jgi:hypothetical protein
LRQAAFRDYHAVDLKQTLAVDYRLGLDMKDDWCRAAKLKQTSAVDYRLGLEMKED